MKKAEILTVCSHPEILQTMVRLVNNNPEWNATATANETEAVACLSAQPFDVVLLGSGMDETSAEILKALHPHIKIIQHYGGGSGLLSAEIYGALEQ